MYRLARFLSTVAILAAALAVSVSYLGFPPVSYEGMVLLSAVAIVLAIGAGGLSLLLSGALLLQRRPPNPIRPAVVSALAIALATLYVWTM